MEKENKKKLEKKLTIAFQIFALIGLVIIGFYLGKAYKARKVNNDKEEVIKDFGTKLEEFTIDSTTKKYSVKVDGKNIDIENKDDGVYLNNKKINYSYAMGGYTLDKVLILYSVGQVGNNVIFINKDLEEIPFDNRDRSFNKFELVDGVIESTISRYDDMMGCRMIGGFEICDCKSLEKGDLLKKHADELKSLYEDVISGTVKLTYNGKEVKTEYRDKQTVYDIYGKDIEGAESNYCVKTNS